MSSSSSNLVVDIGNSHTRVALCRGGRLTVVSAWATGSTTAGRVARALRGVARGARVGVACVVPGVRGAWRAAARARDVELVFVDARLPLPFRLAYRAPQTLGADRVAALCAAVERCGAPVIVVDAGTATTVDVVDAGGVFRGGIIAPGPAMFTDYLAERTAQLPRVAAAGVVPRVGRDTVEAIRIGARRGYAGMVRELLKGTGIQAPLVVTGGYARLLRRDLGLPAFVDPLLVLRGVGAVLGHAPDGGL